VRIVPLMIIALGVSAAAQATTFTSTAPNGTQNLFPTDGSVTLTDGSMRLNGAQVDEYVFQEPASSVFTIDVTQSDGPLAMVVTTPTGIVTATATAPGGGLRLFELHEVVGAFAGNYKLTISSACGPACAGDAGYGVLIDHTLVNVPESASLLLVASGLVGVASVVRHKSAPLIGVGRLSRSPRCARPVPQHHYPGAKCPVESPIH
jgi:hypothetical protein